jgi:hypothetical protein
MYPLHEAMASAITTTVSVFGVCFFLLLFGRWLERYRDSLAEMVTRKPKGF